MKFLIQNDARSTESEFGKIKRNVLCPKKNHRLLTQTSHVKIIAVGAHRGHKQPRGTKHRIRAPYPFKSNQTKPLCQMRNLCRPQKKHLNHGQVKKFARASDTPLLTWVTPVQTDGSYNHEMSVRTAMQFAECDERFRRYFTRGAPGEPILQI